MQLVSSIDTFLALWVTDPAWRVTLWGLLSALFSMLVYATLSPQQKILGLKAEQRTARRQLMQHDGDFSALGALIRRDLGLSLRQLGLMIIPFLISLVPLFVLMLPLMEMYAAPVSAFGPEWMHSFEFWYIAALVLGSLVIKVVFKIA